MKIEYKDIIDNAWKNRGLLKESNTKNCIRNIIDELDKGRLRIAEPNDNRFKVLSWPGT